MRGIGCTPIHSGGPLVCVTVYAMGRTTLIRLALLSPGGQGRSRTTRSATERTVVGTPNRRRCCRHCKTARRKATDRWRNAERAANLLARIAVIVEAAHQVARDAGLM